MHTIESWADLDVHVDLVTFVQITINWMEYMHILAVISKSIDSHFDRSQNLIHEWNYISTGYSWIIINDVTYHLRTRVY